VVKVIGVPEVIVHTADVDAHRELAVYQSGVFAPLQGGVRSAYCYALQEWNGLHFLWLEDLSSAPQAPWIPDYYIQTAGHFGQFNAHWPEHALPSWSWLNIGGLRRKYHAQHFSQVFKQLPTFQSDPLVRRALPPDVLQRLLQLWDVSDELFRQVEQTAKGVCHLDCHPKNLFPIYDAEAGSFTVAIDWAWVGIDCLGADVGLLLASPLKWLELSLEEAAALVEPMFEAYMSGLAEAGWSGNEDRVRLTYLACLGTGEAIRITGLLSSAVTHPEFHTMVERLLMVSADEVYTRWGEAQRFFLTYHNEALRLARSL
jgi:hypothetical protein